MLQSNTTKDSCHPYKELQMKQHKCMCVNRYILEGMKSKPDNASVSPPKKARFAPRIPVRKKPKSAAAKGNKSQTKGDVIDKELLAKLDNAKIAHQSEASLGRRVLKMEKKSSQVKVAFGPESTSLMRSFGNPNSSVSESKHEEGSDMPPTALKEYVEPWDYVRSYYPITLPLRRPYSGDPEIRDKEEFSEDSANGDNKPSVPQAEELGLMEASKEPQMFLFQLPAALPLSKQPTASVDIKGTANAGNKGSGSRTNVATVDGKMAGGRQDTDDKSRAGCSLEDLPGGFMGKMLVHKSGKIKMKIGDALFDVSPGQNCVFAQDLAVVNVKEKHCCILGDLPKRAVVTPDVDSLLESVESV